ncbi:MAG: SMI1/KNR4 family protein [Cyanobacteriota bacterium]|nr:SMI1/KNR4 family protein [Cyanobacteriota bacterium]
MSVLTDSLNQIMRWLEENRPDYAASFLPGLSDAEIREKLANVELELPEEIYELYRWRNGVEDGEDSKSLIFPCMEYMTLDEALEYYDDFLENTIDIFDEQDFQDIFELLDANQINQYGNKKYLFPFYRSNCDFLAVLLSKEKQQHSPIININDVLELSFIYRNLTSMMQTLAEYLEAGAHYLDKEQEYYLNGDEEKMLPIFQKYNPELELMT